MFSSSLKKREKRNLNLPFNDLGKTLINLRFQEGIMHVNNNKQPFSSSSSFASLAGKGKVDNCCIGNHQTATGSSSSRHCVFCGFSSFFLLSSVARGRVAHKQKQPLLILHRLPVFLQQILCFVFPPLFLYQLIRTR